MSSIDTRPTVYDIDHYAGDTLVIHVKVAAAVIAGREFTAQARARRTGHKIDATFVIIPTAIGADVQLNAADSQRLAARGKWEGYWDVQLAMPGGLDPVTTLAHGELRLHNDVTRRPK